MEKEKKQRCNIERIILILTFLCVLMGTIYSVRLSHMTIDQLSIEIRPWIIFLKLKKVIEQTNGKSMIGYNLVLKNVGKVPAYCSIERKTFNNQELIPIDNANINRPFVIMPDEAKTINDLGVTFPSLPSKELPDITLIDELRVNYSDNKECLEKYYTYQKLKFDQKENQEYIWSVIDSDFK